jgi:drug/metabolite transporter (DMT)-like permease
MTRQPTAHRDSNASMKLLLVALFVVWSISFTAIKYLRADFSPGELVLARYLPAAIFGAVYLAAAPSRRRECAEIFRSAKIRIVAMGLTGITGYNYFLYVGQSEIRPGAAALLTTLSPLFTLILAVIFLHERVPLRRILGIFIALAGLYVVVHWGSVGLGRSALAHSDIHYVLITALAPLCWATYTILGKNLLERNSPMTVMLVSVIVGAIPMLAAARGPFFDRVAALSPGHWLALGYLTVLCTVAGFWAWFAALRRMSATSVASFVYLNPVLAAVFGSLFFGERVARLFVVGGAVMLLGLYLAQGGGENGSPKSEEPVAAPEDFG